MLFENHDSGLGDSNQIPLFRGFGIDLNPILMIRCKMILDGLESQIKDSLTRLVPAAVELLLKCGEVSEKGGKRSSILLSLLGPE